jgi:hypothetical protein
MRKRPGRCAQPRLIPLPEPARRGLINLADDVIAATNQAVAAAAQLDPSDMTRSSGSIKLRLPDTQPSPFRSFARKGRLQEGRAGELRVNPSLSGSLTRARRCATLPSCTQTPKKCGRPR